MNKYRKNSLANLIRQSAPQTTFQLSRRQIERLKSISQILLAAVAVAGIVAVTVAAPNILQLLKYTKWGRKKFFQKGKNRGQEIKISQACYYLKRQGYIELVPQGHDIVMKITEKGRKKIRRMNFENLAVPAAKNWNGHWWLVLADIPSRLYRSRADLLRKKIRELGFYPLQRTVWVYPFDPQNEVNFISCHYNVDRFLTTVEAVSLEPEDNEKLIAFYKKRGILK